MASRVLPVLVVIVTLIAASQCDAASVRIIEPRDEIVRLHAGDDVTVICVSSTGQQLVWYVDDRPIRHNHRLTISVHETTGSDPLQGKITSWYFHTTTDAESCRHLHAC